MPENGRRDAVLFASWVPEHALPVGRYFLNMLARHHHDSKIFVGVNRGSSPDWVSLLNECSLDIQQCVPRECVGLNSDATGFVAALDHFRQSNEQFNLVWFIHTKGASSPLYGEQARVRWTFEKRLWSQREKMNQIFEDERVGVYAPNWHPPNQEAVYEIAALRKMLPSRLQPLGLMALSTSYVMRANIVDRFCRFVDPLFFDEGPAAFGGTRFFFEYGMPSVPTLFGLEPFIDAGVGATTLPATGQLDAVVSADEPQNHLLASLALMRWRNDPENYYMRSVPTIETYQI